MSITEPQRRLLDRAAGEQSAVVVSGSNVRVAEALVRKGLATLAIGGSGVAYQAPWWYELTPTPAGREAVRQS